MGGCSIECVVFGTFVQMVLWISSHALSGENGEPPPSHRKGYLKQCHP